MPQKKSTSTKAKAKKPRTSSSREVGMAKDSAMRITAAERRKIEKESAMWQAQDDLRALRASQEIMADTNRMKRVEVLINQEMKALQSAKMTKRG